MNSNPAQHYTRLAKHQYQTMPPSYKTALWIVIVSVLWIASGVIFNQETDETKTQSTAHKTATVRVDKRSAESIHARVHVQGMTQADQAVTLLAETTGQVQIRNLQQGASVNKGDIIVTLKDDARTERLDEAKASLDLRQTEYNAARKLASKGFNSQIKLSGAKAALSAAKAALQIASLELDNATIEAPFNGFVDEIAVDEGDFVTLGTPVATVLDMNPLTVTVQVSENHIFGVQEGAQTHVTLPDGTELTGNVTFVGAKADPATRTFKVEIEIDNPENSYADGLTAAVDIPLASVMAHRISPAILTLNDQGLVGIKVVDDTDHARFYPAEIVRHDNNAAYITGLPHTVRIITVGQEFVDDGQKVIAVDESSIEKAPTQTESK